MLNSEIDNVIKKVANHFLANMSIKMRILFAINASIVF